MGVILDNIKRIAEERRESQGISKSELARRMGYTASHISQVLSGKNALSEHLIEKFCLALEIDVEELTVMDPIIHYQNPEHDTLHRRQQRLLDLGHSVSVERALAAIEQAILNAVKKR